MKKPYNSVQSPFSNEITFKYWISFMDSLQNSLIRSLLIKTFMCIPTTAADTNWMVYFPIFRCNLLFLLFLNIFARTCWPSIWTHELFFFFLLWTNGKNHWNGYVVLNALVTQETCQFWVFFPTFVWATCIACGRHRSTDSNDKIWTTHASAHGSSSNACAPNYNTIM